MKDAFRKLAQSLSDLMASAGAFLAACLIVIARLATGPLFHYSDTWQLVINTGTSVITFLMVFLIQDSQSRDTRALRLKLDELLRANEILEVHSEPVQAVGKSFELIRPDARGEQEWQLDTLPRQTAGNRARACEGRANKEKCDS